MNDPGTFSVCATCKQHCCSRLGMDAPVLLDGEAERIAWSTWSPVESVMDPAVPGQMPTLKQRSNCCQFYRGGKCTIHDIRPLDCRLFPFDLMQAKGDLYLIAHTAFCPEGFDISSLIEDALLLLAELWPDRIRYANHETPLLSHGEYRVIGKLDDRGALSCRGVDSG